MKRRIRTWTAVLLTALMMFMLGSCLRMEIGLTVNKDGSFDFYDEITIKKSALSEMNMTEEEFYSSLDESMETADEKTTVEKVSLTVDGEEYIGTRLMRKFASAEELEADFTSSSTDNLGITYSKTQSGFDTTISITLKNGSESTSESAEAAQYVTEGMMKTLFKISVPVQIKETNGALSDDKLSATWDINALIGGQEKEHTFSVTYTDMSGLIPIIVIAAAVVIIAVIVVITAVAKRKKSLPYNNSFAAVPPDQQIKKFCPNCGTQTDGSSGFCPNCGSKIE